MKTIILKRVSHTEKGTFGVMICEGIPFCVTMELPWRDNKRNVSCIPEGVYSAEKSKNPGKRMFHIPYVRNRTFIKIHVGNIVDDSEGCILVGEKFEPINNEFAIRESVKAFEELKTVIGDNNVFALKIIAPIRSEYVTA